MKKRFIQLLILVFIFIPSFVSAASINTVDIYITLDNEGNATVSEKWNIKAQDEEFIIKDFNDAANVTVTDITITDIKNSVYKQTKKFDKNKDFTYAFIDSGKKKRLKFTTLNEDNTFTINYKLSGVINSYSDIFGLDYVFIAKTKGQTIGTLNIYVNGPIALNTENTAIYAIGNNLSATFENSAIHLFSSNLTQKSEVRLMTTFNELTFNKFNKKELKFKDYYEEVLNRNELYEEIKDLISKQSVKYVLIAIVFVIIILIILKIVALFKSHDEYSGIITENDRTIDKLENIKYYDSIPCNGDLYKTAFLAGYFKIVKNRSNLIGALLLKWYYEGYIKIGYDKTRPYIKLLQNHALDRKLDIDLYDILNAASSYQVIDGSKLYRYATEHYLRMMTWFNMGFNESISDEFARGNIKKIKKMGKVRLVIQDKLIDEANRIQGLKRYLLNFNQVPRQTELTEQGYKYLLINAELLGIGAEVAKEILRKSPDNQMAKQLLEIEQCRYIFKSVYQTALTPYKQVVKNKKMSLAYDTEMDNLVTKKTEEVVEVRTSRL